MGIWRYEGGTGLPESRKERHGSMGVGVGELRGTHVPVLMERCLALLAPALDAAARDGRPPVHVDATVGLGGHARAVLQAHPAAVLVGLDRDPEALTHARARLAEFGDRVHLVHAVYDELPAVLARLGHCRADGILFDLGVSSLQLDAVDRGFAYARDAPLDMRMDQSAGPTAADVVNGYAEPELVRVLRDYGEERYAGRIARAIGRQRAREPITSSALLAELVREAIPAPARRTGGNPAKRTFQALRIEVNKELKVLESALPAALDALAPGGRLVVLSYHSLEDRITKRAIAARARSTGPVDLPVELPGAGPSVRLLTRGAELPTEAEIAANPRAASARLRAVERLPDGGGTDRERSRSTVAPRPPGRSVTAQTWAPRAGSGTPGPGGGALDDQGEGT